jgi:drug/metabolite transporter (DMT)-like permease
MTWWLASILAAFLWGVSFTLQEQIIKCVDKSTFLFLSSIGFLATYGLLFTKTVRTDCNTMSGKTLGYIILASATGMLANYLALISIQKSNASLSSICQMTYPFFCMILAWVFFGESVNIKTIIGGIVTFSGVYIITRS